MQNKSKTLLASLVGVRMASSKKQTHYEALELKPSATQGEIKAAYYRMSKLFHPDVNKAAGADTKFRGITDAYEVLGSKISRKTYDRSLALKSERSQNIYTGEALDPSQTRFRQKKTDIKGTPMASESVGTYNFDAWTKAHYSENFAKFQHLKKNQERAREKMKEQKERKEQYEKEEGVFTMAIVACLIMFVIISMINSSTRELDTAKVQTVNNKSSGKDT